MSTNASITVYLQALGGKFLGPNAFNTNDITVVLSYSGVEVVIPYQLSSNGTTDDGTISQGFTDGSSSFMPILNMPALSGQNPNVFYLTPDANTIVGKAQFALPATTETGLLTVTIPSPSGNAITLTQTVIITPQQTAYTLTVVVPGLMLKLNTSPITGSVSVYVAMMCGCKVTVGLPNSFWSPSDFTVHALVQYTNGTSTWYPLSLDTQTNNSLFSAPVTNEANIQSILFTAQQKSTGNYGVIVQGS